MKEKKIIYYNDNLIDDFGTVAHNPAPLKDGFKYIHKNFFYNLLSNFVYYCMGMWILRIIAKIGLGIKVKGKKNLKKIDRKQGYFLYTNHTTYSDAYLMNLYCSRAKRCYVVANADIANIGFVGGLACMLGAFPLPRGENEENKNNFKEAMKTHIEKGRVISIYPEAHIWRFYTGTRPMRVGSFKYPCIYNAPMFVISNTYRKGVFGLPRVTITISEPIWPDQNLSVEEGTRYLCKKAEEVFDREITQKKDNFAYYDYRPKSQQPIDEQNKEKEKKE